MNRGPAGPIARVRYVLPRHKAANWVGPGRSRKSARPANGVVELSPFEFLNRLADLVQADDDRAIFQPSPDELPVIDIHSL